MLPPNARLLTHLFAAGTLTQVAVHAGVGTTLFNMIVHPTTGDLLVTLRDQPLAGIPYLGFVGVGVYALYLLLAELPQTLSLARGTA